MKSPSLENLLEVAIEAARLGGKRTLKYFNTGIKVETKADNTPVTRADRESEELIRKRILKIYPHHAIMGEEGGETEGNPDYRWIIDPIDGTKTFIRGVPLYGVLVGLEVKQVPSVGVVYIPALDEMLSAATGLGCHWNGQPAHVSKTTQLSEATLLCSDVNMCNQRSSAWESLTLKTKVQRTWGDCYGYVLVATGRADIMVDPAMNPWECAPFPPIFKEAGGTFTDWTGKSTLWGKNSVATNGTLHKKVLEILKKD